VIDRVNEYSIVAIDGPAASGKSSVAHRLAELLSFSHVNSGIMYRAVAWFAYRHGIDLNDQKTEYIQSIQSGALDFRLREGTLEVVVDGDFGETHLKDEVVNRTVSVVAAIPEIRAVIVQKLRKFITMGNIVMEGRDIGSVVFPETPYKFYIDASLEVRQQRRAAQGLQDNLAVRDRLDSSRLASPLVVAPDADIIDSSSLTIEEVVIEIVGRLKIKGLREAQHLQWGESRNVC
jgi:CMP/dCMP kinase